MRDESFTRENERRGGDAAAPRRYVWLAVVVLAWGVGLFDGWRFFA